MSAEPCVAYRRVNSTFFLKFTIMKEYFVYILQCSDDSYYTGVTNNVDKRVMQHNSGEDSNAYVHRRRPARLVWYAGFSNPETAIEKEKQIKGWSRAKKEALIAGKYELLPALSRKKFK